MFRHLSSLLLTLSLVGLADQARGDSLVSYLPLNGTLTNAVNSAFDGSFGSWNETVVDGGPVDATGTDPTFVPGLFGGMAVQFTGSSSTPGYPNPPTTSGNFVSVPDGGGLNGATNATVSMWVQWNGIQPEMVAGDSNTANQYGCVLGRRQVSGFWDPQIGINGDDPATCQGLRYGQSQWMDGNNTPADMGRGYGMPEAPNTVSPGDNTWVNIVTTIDSSTVAMYMNGVLLRSVTDSPLGNDSRVPLTIGAYYGTDYQYGPSNSTICDVGVFNSTLTAGQAEAIYNTPAIAALNNYNLGIMDQLFDLYAAGTGSVRIGSLTWQSATGLTGAAGNAWEANGTYYVQLDASGGGVEALAQVDNPGQVITSDPVVDINDLTIVLANFGKTGCVWSQGCMDGDPTGTVDVNDLTIVLSNFGVTYGAAGMRAAPEPSCLALISIGAVGLIAYGWQRRRAA